MKIRQGALISTLIAAFSGCMSTLAMAADTHRDPFTVLNALSNHIYVLGETSGNGQDMVVAERAAAEEIRRYIASGFTDGLVANEQNKQSPLAAAAYMGYPNVVAALLTSNIVRAHINDANGMGITPWVAAILSMKQSLWACNPAVFADPYKFVPMLVIQPFYTFNPTSPYMKVRKVLEATGANPDMSKAKEFWLTNCKSQSEESKAKVLASADLQKTVQELGAEKLGMQLNKMREKSREQKVK